MRTYPHDVVPLPPHAALRCAGEAENQLATITDAQRAGSKGAKGAAPVRKGTKGKRYGTGPATTDEQLMARLGETFGGNMREDFIVAHMQEVCTFCRLHVHGGGTVYRFRAAPGQTPPKSAPERKFEGIKLEGGVVAPVAPVSQLTLCPNCYGAESQAFSTQQPSRLPAGVTPMDLYMEKLEQQEQWPGEPDPTIENEFFETRQTFLSLCQGNHYQFDTLRRAKHSSMMVLYHLHNPSAPAFTTSCNVCGLEIEPGQGFRCSVCQDFDLCSSCERNVGHPHPLVVSVRGLCAAVGEGPAARSVGPQDDALGPQDNAPMHGMALDIDRPSHFQIVGRLLSSPLHAPGWQQG